MQIAKPMWPFIAASAVTYYLVAQMQDMGVRCASLPPLPSLLPSNMPLDPRPVHWNVFISLAEQWKNDPRNPYVAQIKKEEAHH